MICFTHAQLFLSYVLASVSYAALKFALGWLWRKMVAE